MVGLHIVAKTPTRPQWIWSTFEHVDNVPGPGATAPFTFNNGDATSMPAQNPVQCPCPPSAPAPYNVERIKPIYEGNGSPYSTASTNEKYRAKLMQEYPSSPLQNYQLVMTQWPVTASRPDLDGSPGNTFPGTAFPPFDQTAFANTTLETFKQNNVNQGCMGCHNQDKRFDFVFTLATRAYPRALSALPPDHANILGAVGKLPNDSK
jgi:hypothetical protein